MNEVLRLQRPTRLVNSLVEGGLHWVVRHRDSFLPPSSSRGDEGAERHKAFVELALMIWRLRRDPKFKENYELGELLRLVEHVFAFDTFQAQLTRVDDLFIANVLLHNTLKEAGESDDGWDLARMQCVLDGSTIQVAERPAHRALEVRHALDSAGLRHTLPSYRALARCTILSKPFPLVRVTDYDAYSVTHALFYLSDWGCSPLVGLSAAAVRRAERAVEELLTMYVYARNWDLVGELLISAHILGQVRKNVHATALRALRGAQLADGCVPGPTFKTDEGKRQRRMRSDDRFWNCYHTTLVAILVGAICDD